METKWTPGPWTFVSAETLAIKDANMNTLATANLLHLRGRRPIEECEANAHLIAAAPDLYSTLEWLRDNPGVDIVVRYATIEAALAKARGETHE